MMTIPLGEEPEKEGEDMGPFHVIAQEIIEAVDKKDPVMLAECLHAFYEECELLEVGEDEVEEDY